MSLRSMKIKSVLEDDYYYDDYDKVREIERICGDYRIRDFAEKQIRDLRGGWTHAHEASRRIDEEQYYYDRKREEGD